MNNRPGFCETCNTPLDPGDDSRECWKCDSDEYSGAWEDDWTYWIWEEFTSPKSPAPTAPEAKNRSEKIPLRLFAADRAQSRGLQLPKEEPDQRI